MRSAMSIRSTLLNPTVTYPHYSCLVSSSTTTDFPERPRLHGRKMPAKYRDESALYPFTRRPGKIPGRNAGPFFIPSFD
ncbi:hypothetical protein TNCV_534091 [Trichonephila clavipes]|nr:hypothetical protein TNCV_534091 [Trichonephila clavipes]